MSIWALVSWQPSFFELALIWGWKSDVRRRHKATKKAESRIKERWERKTTVRWRKTLGWTQLDHVWPQAILKVRLHGKGMMWPAQAGGGLLACRSSLDKMIPGHVRKCV